MDGGAQSLRGPQRNGPEERRGSERGIRGIDEEGIAGATRFGHGAGRNGDFENIQDMFQSIDSV